MEQSTFTLKLARLLSISIAVVLVLLPFHAFATTWLASAVGHHDLMRIWKEILLVLTLPGVLWLAWRHAKLRDYLLHSWIVRLFACYILLHIALGVWAIQSGDVNSEALIYSYIINLRFLGFFLICLVVASYNDFLFRNWRKIILLPAAVVVTFGLLQKFLLPTDILRHFGYGPGSLPVYQTVDSQIDFRRIQSTLRGANPLGAYLLIVMAATVVTLRKNRIYLVMALTASLIVLFFSYSRSAWLGLVIAFSFFAGFSASRKFSLNRMIFVYVATALLVGTGIYALRYNNSAQNTFFHTSSESAAPQSSNEVRAQALKQGVVDIADEPIGRGPGTAGPASFRNDNRPRIAENYFLQIGQEVGVLGMALFIAISAIVAMQLWAKRNQQLVKVLLISLAGITVVNLVSHAWADDTLSYLWWGLAGVALAPSIIKNASSRVA